MRLNKIKELLKEIKELSYEEYISLLVLNEKIDYNSDIQDITNGDLDFIKNWIENTYMENDISLYSEEFNDFINKEVEYGSEYHNVFCFNNKLKLAKKIKELEKMGYVERGYESILKSNGVEQYFDTIEQAQEKAEEMRKLVSSADYFVENMEVNNE